MPRVLNPLKPEDMISADGNVAGVAKVESKDGAVDVVVRAVVVAGLKVLEKELENGAAGSTRLKVEFMGLKPGRIEGIDDATEETTGAGGLIEVAGNAVES